MIDNSTQGQAFNFKGLSLSFCLLLAIVGLLPALHFQTASYYSFIKLPVFQILVLSVASTWIVALWRGKKLSLYVGRELWALGAYALLLIASIAYGDFSLASSLHVLMSLVLIVWCLILAQLTFDKRCLVYLQWATIFGAVLTCCLGLWYVKYVHSFRMTFPLGNPNYFSAYLLLPILLCFKGLLEALKVPAAKESSVSLKPIILALCLLLFARVHFLAESQAGNCALFAAFVAAGILHFRCWRLWPLVLGIVVVGAVWLIASRGGITTFLEDLSWRHPVRYVGIETGLQMLSDAPLFGHGDNTFFCLFPTYATAGWQLRPGFGDFLGAAHNEYIEIMVGLGLVGLLLFLALAIIPLVLIARQRPKDYIPFAAAHVGLLVFMTFSVAMRYYFIPIIFWTNLGLLIGRFGGFKKDNICLAIGLTSLKKNRMLAWGLGLACCWGIVAALLSFRAEVNYQHARRAFSEGGYEICQGLLHESLPDLVSYSRRVLAQKRLADSYAEQGNRRAAYAAFERVNAMAPNFLGVTQVLSGYEYEFKNKQSGLLSMLNALEKDPFNWIFRRNVAQLLALEKNIDFLKPSLSPTMWQCAQALRFFSMQRSDRALTIIETIDDSQSKAMFLAPFKADCLLELNRFKEARALYREHLIAYPYHSEGHMGLVRSAVRLGNREAVRQAYAPMKTTMPEQFNILFHQQLASIMLRYKLYDEAFLEYSNLEARREEQMLSLIGYLETCVALGKNAKAMSLLEKITYFHHKRKGSDAQRERIAVQGRILLQRHDAIMEKKGSHIDNLSPQ